MSTTFNTIQNNYIQNFPAEVPTKAAQGFIATATISLISGSGTSVALLGGVIAATATLIEAITRPIIRAIFPETPFIAKCIQIFIPQMIALSLAASIAPWIGLSYKITTIILPLLAWIALNDRFFERNVGMVEIL